MEQRSYTASLDCSYLLDPPQEPVPNPSFILALHGYGQNPEAMLRLVRRLVGPERWIASLQGPNQHFLSGDLASATVGYNWGTRAHWETSIALHHRMMRHVLDDLVPLGRTPERTLLVGFSQPVGLNYRFVATHPGLAGGVIGICGGVPKDWETGAEYHTVDAALLHIARDQDEFFPAETANGFPGRLKTRAADVEYHLLPGPHRFPSKVQHVVEPWLKRVFGK